MFCFQPVICPLTRPRLDHCSYEHKTSASVWPFPKCQTLAQFTDTYTLWSKTNRCNHIIIILLSINLLQNKPSGKRLTDCNVPITAGVQHGINRSCDWSTVWPVLGVTISRCSADEQSTEWHFVDRHSAIGWFCQSLKRGTIFSNKWDGDILTCDTGLLCQPQWQRHWVQQLEVQQSK